MMTMGNQLLLSIHQVPIPAQVDYKYRPSTGRSVVEASRKCEVVFNDW